MSSGSVSDAERPLTVREAALVVQARHVVDECAKRILRTHAGLIEDADLRTIGKLGLSKAARRYKPEFNPSFEDYARRLVRCAMLEAIRTEAFHARVDREMRCAADRHLAHYNISFNTLSDSDAAIASHTDQLADAVAAAAFCGGVAEAKGLGAGEGEDAVVARQEYARAIEVLDELLREGLTEDEGRVAVALFRDKLTLEGAAEACEVAFITIRRRRDRLFKKLRKALLARGIDTAPEPMNLVRLVPSLLEPPVPSGGLADPSKPGERP